MKIVVIGGTGLIGSELVTRPRADGHDLLAASPGTGVVPRGDATTGLDIASDRFRAQLCADMLAPQAARMSITQRPATFQAAALPAA